MTLAALLFACVPALAAVTVAALVWLAGRLPRPAQSRSRPVGNLPAWLRLALPVSVRCESVLRPLLPVAVRATLTKSLARCDLDLAVSAEGWVAVRTLYTALALLLGLVLAPAFAFSPWELSAAAGVLVWFATGRWLVTLRRRREASLHDPTGEHASVRIGISPRDHEQTAGNPAERGGDRRIVCGGRDGRLGDRLHMRAAGGAGGFGDLASS